MSVKSYSQHGQDVYLIENIYKNKRNGYFIELGASDGKHISNTYLLEQRYDWKGICIEPNAKFYKKLVKNRKPSTVCVNSLVYKDTCSKTFISADYLSGIADTITRGYLRKKDVRAKFSWAKDETELLNTVTLTTILEKYNAPKFIEYLSLDTEGSEYDILQGLDFNKYIIGYICVEHNNNTEQRDNIRKLLVNNGYVFHRENIIDDEYKHSSLEL